MDGQIPSTMILNAADVQRMITAAAHEAAQEVDRQSRLSREDVEGMIETGIERFCDRLGIPTEKKEMAEWRDDMAKMRASVAFQDELKSHGFKAALGLIVISLITAIYIGVQSVLRK